MQVTLPPLIGSEKQISWATKIRDSVTSGYQYVRPESCKEICMRWIFAHDLASWWIDHRSPYECMTAWRHTFPDGDVMYVPATRNMAEEETSEEEQEVIYTKAPGQT